METTVDRFLSLACLTYTSDDPSRREEARVLLDAEPSLADDLRVAAVLARSDTVAACLAADPEAARRVSGPNGWPPLLYLTYGRVYAPRPGESAAAAASQLLAAGADPNAGFWWGDQYWFSAITGALGEGEQGPHRQPPHPEDAGLLDVLLAAGARGDDAQSLYNRMFSGRCDHLGPLLAHGLTASSPANWRDRPGGAQGDTPVLGTLLAWDAAAGHLERAAMLLAAGVDPRGIPDPHGTPWRRATLGGHAALAALLEAYGAAPEPLTLVERFCAVLLAGDGDAARALLASDAGLLSLVLASHPVLLERAAVHPAGTAALHLALDLGVPTSLRSAGATALHHAAWAGRTDSIAVLLAAGADPTATDSRFGATPHGWALHAGHNAAAAQLDPALRGGA